MPENTIFFGKSCCGKTTYLGEHLNGAAVDCDKEVWNYVNTHLKIQANHFKRNMLMAIHNNNSGMYYSILHTLVNSIDYEKMFSERCYYDAPVIGNYFQYIPKKILSRFRLVKISTSEENRAKFAKAKGWTDNFYIKLDNFYEDPPYWDEEIIVKDI